MIHQDLGKKVSLPVREGKMQEDIKDSPLKTSSKSLAVALISLTLKNGQIPFLWTLNLKSATLNS